MYRHVQVATNNIYLPADSLWSFLVKKSTKWSEYFSISLNTPNVFRPAFSWSSSVIDLEMVQWRKRALIISSLLYAL